MDRLLQLIEEMMDELKQIDDVLQICAHSSLFFKSPPNQRNESYKYIQELIKTIEQKYKDANCASDSQRQAP